MKAHLLTIGDEILIGQIVDTNSAWMSQQLNLRGIQVEGKSSVGDTREAIVAGIRHAAANADIIIMTGGLGPTKDDITKKTIAEMFGLEMALHTETFQRIEAYFEKIKKVFRHESAVLQSTLPVGITVLTNKMGTAPGMWLENEGKVYVSLPGVPWEMEYLMSHEVLPRLAARFQTRPIAHRTILTACEGETNIAKRIEHIEDALPPNLKLAYLPALGSVRLRLTGVWQGEVLPDSEAQLSELLDLKKAEIVAELPDLVYGFEDSNLQTVVGELLRERGLKIGTAESCTGGYIAHLITSVAGASDYFPASVVAYSYEMKTKLLGVSAGLLEKNGAVSQECVEAMARGALETLGVDVALAVSGIAGPGGGTVEKPVGTVWMAVASRERVLAEKQIFGRDRLKNIQLTGIYGLNLVRRFLLERSFF